MKNEPMLYQWNQYIIVFQAVCLTFKVSSCLKLFSPVSVPHHRIVIPVLGGKYHKKLVLMAESKNLRSWLPCTWDLDKERKWGNISNIYPLKRQNKSVFCCWSQSITGIMSAMCITKILACGSFVHSLSLSL